MSLLSTPLSTPLYPHDIHGDAWHWVAHYTDGSLTEEYCPESGQGRPFASVLFHKLAYIELVPQYPDLPGHILTLPSGEDKVRPIFFRRRLAVMNVGQAETIAWRPITCLGWQKTVWKKTLRGDVIEDSAHNVQSFTFFLENGSVVVSEDRDALTFGADGLPSLRLPE